MTSKTMEMVSIHLPEAYLEGLKELVRLRLYPNISEAVRTAVREFLKRECAILGLPWHEVLGVRR
mgnify:CR=1 FL=1